MMRRPSLEALEERLLYNADAALWLGAPVVAEVRTVGADADAARPAPAVAPDARVRGAWLVADRRAEDWDLALADLQAASPPGVTPEVLLVDAREDAQSALARLAQQAAEGSSVHVLPWQQAGRAWLGDRSMQAADCAAALGAQGAAPVGSPGARGTEVWCFDLAALDVSTVSPTDARESSLPAAESRRFTTATPRSSGTELVFIDAGVADASLFLADLARQRDVGRDIEAVLLDGEHDGLAQISAALAGRSGVAAVHIVSHGSDGLLQLGNSLVDSATLQARQAELRGWQAAMTAEADLLLWGCDVAAGSKGDAFMGELAALTGADVAASDDATGATALGGDWVLERATGSVEASLDTTALADWSGLLSITANGAASTASVDSGTSLTWSHTVAAGTSSVMFVTLAIDGLGANVTGVTYGGTALTQVGRTTGNHAVEIWRLATPAVGTANVVVSLGASTAVAAGAVVYDGVDLAAPTSGYIGAAGTGTTASINVSSATGNLVLDVTNWDGAAGGYAVGAGQSVVSSTASSLNTGKTSTEAGAAAVTMSSTVSSSAQWEMAGVSIQAAANTAPVNTVPGAQATNEDTAKVFSAGNGNQISIADADAGGANNHITLSVTNGTLTLAGTTGLTFSAGDGTADATMTFTGTAANINTALNGLSFIPTADYNGSATLTLATTDATLLSLNVDTSLKGRYTFENTGALGTDTSPTAGFPGTVSGSTAVNDGTRGNVISMAGAGYVQTTGHFGNPSNVTLSAWVNLTSADSTAADVISLGDSVVLRLDNAGKLRGIYADSGSYNFTDYTTTLAGTGWHHVAFTFDDASNVQALYLDGVVVSTTNATTSIAYNKGANSFIGKHGNGSTTYDFNGKIDDARIYSRALTAAEVAALAEDQALVDTDTVAITVSAVNDAPVVTPTGTTLAYTENGAATTVDSAVSVSDADTTQLASATVSITSGFATGQDLLAFTNQNGITGSWNAATGVLSLTGSATVRQLPDRAAQQSPTPTARTTRAPPPARSRSRSTTAAPTATPPPATSRSPPSTTPPSSPPPAPPWPTPRTVRPPPVDGALTVSDADTTNLASATVSITSGFATGQDLLAFTNQNGITGSWNAATGVLSLTRQRHRRQLPRPRCAASPTPTARTTRAPPPARCSFTVNDGSANSNTATRNVSVAAVNDAPVVATTGTTLAYTENGTAAAVDGALTVSDADTTNLASATVSITSGFASGQDLLAFTNQNGISGTWNASTGVLSLTGSATVANYQTGAAQQSPTPTARTTRAPPPARCRSRSTTAAPTATPPRATSRSPPSTTRRWSLRPPAATHRSTPHWCFPSGNGNLISVADADAGAGTLQVSLTVSNGRPEPCEPHGLELQRGRWQQRRHD